MKNIVDIVQKFEGIIGAILGVAVTLVLTEVNKKLGKVYYYFIDYNYSFHWFNNGFYEVTDNREKAENFEYKFKMQLYNSSQTIKILRDIFIEFNFNNGKINDKPNDVRKNEYKQHYTVTHELSTINATPQQIIEFEISGFIDTRKADIKKLGEINKIYFIAKSHKGKKIRKLIYKTLASH